MHGRLGGGGLGSSRRNIAKGPGVIIKAGAGEAGGKIVGAGGGEDAEAIAAVRSISEGQAVAHGAIGSHHAHCHHAAAGGGGGRDGADHLEVVDDHRVRLLHPVEDAVDADAVKVLPGDGNGLGACGGAEGKGGGHGGEAPILAAIGSHEVSGAEAGS